MGEFVVRGGRRLDGAVRINGAKNAALPIMAASLLASEPVRLRRVPQIRDVRVMAELLRALGARVDADGDTLRIDAAGLKEHRVPDALMQEMRASVFVMGPLLVRRGRAAVVQPGGCAIGDRPIDLHLEGLMALGAEVKDEGGATEVVARRLHGGEIHLSFPSVGATENILMAAAGAAGETRIRNAAMEPEVVDLAQFLEKLGAKIRGAGTPEIRVVGSPALGGAEHAIIPDRIETATFALAVAAAGGRVTIAGCLTDHLPGFWSRLREIGVEVREIDAETVVVEAPSEYRPKSIAIRTGPYPGFATDMQAQFMAFLLRVPGVHIVSERVFENRLGHVGEFRRMGAQIMADQRVAMIYGGRRLRGATVKALDLRAGTAMIIAGLAAEGTTRILQGEVVERGHERLVERLAELGADLSADWSGDRMGQEGLVY